MSFVQRVVGYVRMHGLGYTFHRACEMFGERVFRSYDREFRKAAPDAAELGRQRANQPEAGLISVAVPVYNTRPDFLRALVDSLCSQTYAAWEAVLYDGCSTDSEALAAMDQITDARIRVVHGKENRGISGNTNAAVALCRGAYVALCDHDDVLTPDAMWHVATAIAQHQPDMLYSDEDKLTEDGRCYTDPHRKPDFSPDTLRSGNYICHLMVIRKALYEQLGGMRPAFDGSQDHDLALRISEVTRNICHIPHTLYHWRTVHSSVSHQHLARCQEAAARAVAGHMARIGYPGTCSVEDGMLRLRYDVPEEVVLRVVHTTGQNPAAQMNQAAENTTADVLLFVHESVEGLDESDVQELLMYAQRSDAGAVTPMLTDRRGHVMHAGFDCRKGTLYARNAGLRQHAGGWHGLNRLSGNTPAVSAACVMIRRENFLRLDEALPIGLCMAEWCSRLHANGTPCIVSPHASAVCTNKTLLGPFGLDDAACADALERLSY